AANISAGTVVHENVEVPAVDVVLANELGFVGLGDRRFQPFALANELPANVDAAGVDPHAAPGDQGPLDKKMRIVQHDLAVLAGTGLRFVGVDDEIARPPVGLLGHERPFETGREPGAAATALAGRLHLVDDGVASLLQDRLGAIPATARTRAVEAPAVVAVEIFENAVLVGEHCFPRLGSVESAIGGFGTGASCTLAASPGFFASLSW